MRFLLFFLLLAGTVFSKTLDVPFVKQRSEFCGPAALSSVFRYYGVFISQEEIGKKTYIPELKGALITDLENYARSKGFKTKSGQGNIEKIKSYINKDIPVIVLVDLGFWVLSRPHYIVVVGYNEKGITAHTGYEKNKFIPYRKFKRIWKKAGNVYLVVYR
ncbi:Peptidase C39 family protein [Persephonella hydrogeniphila]|uniref:Peptidase C39 family protein n=1 Tax=Persephonella hydrogeniphila TaxID=198703 RepID=A0A285NM23_9AQUI|nr:cysteine peptidase family C39 domain-containing protein [Persephonella hydrogeniphila]SNZ10584.1 Peptidase C39 family protein [Persephonella hydrogeniphila]